MLKMPKHDKKRFKNVIKIVYDPSILWLDSTPKVDENRMLKMPKYDRKRVPES